MVFAFIMPIVTYICGGIGIKKANAQIKRDPETPRYVKNLCITAIITTSVLVLFFAIIGAVV